MRHFGPQHTHNGYAAMGNHPARPRSSAGNSGLSTAQSIARERDKAARAAKIGAKKK